MRQYPFLPLNLVLASNMDRLHSKKATLRAWHSEGTSSSWRHLRGVCFRFRQQSLSNRHRFKSTLSPEQGLWSGFEVVLDIQRHGLDGDDNGPN